MFNCSVYSAVQQSNILNNTQYSDTVVALFHVLKTKGEITPHHIFSCNLTTAWVSNSLQKHGPPEGIQQQIIGSSHILRVRPTASVQKETQLKNPSKRRHSSKMRNNSLFLIRKKSLSDQTSSQKIWRYLNLKLRSIIREPQQPRVEISLALCFPNQLLCTDRRN